MPYLIHRDDSDSEADTNTSMPDLINRSHSDSKSDTESDSWEDSDLKADMELEEECKLAEKTDIKLETMSSEILIFIPLKKEDHKYKTYLGLLDIGASTSLADENLFDSSLVTKREGRGSTWKTQIEKFSTSKEIEVTTLRLPQFTKSRKITASFHLYNK